MRLGADSRNEDGEVVSAAPLTNLDWAQIAGQTRKRSGVPGVDRKEQKASFARFMKRAG